MGEVTEIRSKNSFYDMNRDEPEEFYTKGLIKFTSGLMKNRKLSIEPLAKLQFID